ncbi:MAG: amidohydrolase [Deltaproteobacteria bacterium]|jgi:amidohydrolase|nr:amidohydrolase [Deltaproteobacteria bacterium]
MDDITKLVRDCSADMISLRRDIHQRPELGYQEERTSGLVRKYLAETPGLEVTTMTKTGVVGLLKGLKKPDETESGPEKSPSPTLLLRADLDALPLTEETGLSFASTTPGVMHACGHDAHTAILVYAAKILSTLADSFAGNVKFVFQPNEEEVGAYAMIEEGVLDNPKVTAAAALHLWAPIELGKISVADGVSWAGMDHFKIKVVGVGGHTGSPHLAADPILAAAQIVCGAQLLQSRNIDPLLSSALVFGRIEGGKTANVIPPEVELEGTLRYLFDGRDDSPSRPRTKFKALVENIAVAYGTKAEVDYYCSQPPLTNDPKMASLARQAASETLGPESLTAFLNMGGEDFSEFSARVPSVMAMIGAGSVESGAIYPHHSPKFLLDERALPIALEWLCRLALAYFKNPKAVSAMTD